MVWHDGEDDEADLEEREDPDIEDLDPDNAPLFIDCPYCGREISEEAERCPFCGMYVSKEDAPRRVKWWIVVGVVAVLVATLLTSLWWWK